MAKYYALVLIIVILILGWIFEGLGEHNPYREPAVGTPSVHAYDDLSTAIKNISITAYYFVPTNKAADAVDISWLAPLTQALDDLVRFHTLQFAGYAPLSYTIAPQPIIGEQENLAYDTENTDRGNPQALRSIAEEIARKDTPAGADPGSYHVTYIIYDGVGASGMNDGSIHAALLNRRFLVDPIYSTIRETLVAHEFYHTLGIPDGYDLSSGTSTTADIMGLGRTTRPLKETFIDTETLTHLGL